MLVVIVNYKNNENAIKLRDRFSKTVATRLIDSGSELPTSDAKHFDDCLPNVYYNGLINHAALQTKALSDEEPVVFICSDVKVESCANFVARVSKAFTNPKIGVYAPASLGSGHPQMWPAKSGGLRKVSFVEGFCFVARKKIFTQACPIDLSLNRLGWGVDVYFSYIAICFGGISVVDDELVVFHPQSTGYNTSEASMQRNRWFATFPASARFYRFFVTIPGFRSGAGCRVLNFVTSLVTSK